MRVFHSAGKKVYFTLLASSFMFPVSAFAQCVDTQDCQTLGYTETSNSGNCVKCPFGDYWSCPKQEEPEEPQTAVFGQCNGYAKNCKIGDVLYSDGTCSADAIALKSLGLFVWSREERDTDIPDLPNYGDVSSAKKDFDSCGNTQKIIKQGDASIYPAVWAAVNYTPPGIPETNGKWCLPAAGIAQRIINDFNEIDLSLSKVGERLLPTSMDRLWTSSESTYLAVWDFGLDLQTAYKSYLRIENYVRPVIEF